MYYNYCCAFDSLGLVVRASTPHMDEEGVERESGSCIVIYRSSSSNLSLLLLLMLLLQVNRAAVTTAAVPNGDVLLRPFVDDAWWGTRTPPPQSQCRALSIFSMSKLQWSIILTTTTTMCDVCKIRHKFRPLWTSPLDLLWGCRH